MAILLMLVLLFFAYLLSRGNRGSKALYSDKGINSKVFHDRIRGIRAKPDRIEGTKKNAKLDEHKARKGRVYQSDIVQAQASTLAARADGYNVLEAVISTANGKEHIVPLGSDEQIERRISKPLNDARLVASGGIPKAKPVRGKCKSCGYSSVCKYSAA